MAFTGGFARGMFCLQIGFFARGGAAARCRLNRG